MPCYLHWGNTEDNAIVYDSLSEETIEGALKVLRESFFVQESVSRAVDILSEPGATTELEEYCLDAAKDGLCLVALDRLQNEVVGVCINKLQILDPSKPISTFEEFRDNCKCKSSKALLQFMIDVDNKIDLYQKFNTDCIFEIVFLATLPSYGKRGIAEKLVSVALEMAVELKNGGTVRSPVTIHNDCVLTNSMAEPGAVSAIMTSKYSQKIADKLGMETLIRVSYDEFSYEGKKYSDTLGSDTLGCTLVAKKVMDAAK